MAWWQNQANRKTLEGSSHPDRDAQFHHISGKIREFQAERQPVIPLTLRPTSFRPDALRALLRRNKIATLDDLKRALGTPVDITVFRKLSRWTT